MEHNHPIMDASLAGELDRLDRVTEILTGADLDAGERDGTAAPAGSRSAITPLPLGHNGYIRAIRSA